MGFAHPGRLILQQESCLPSQPPNASCEGINTGELEGKSRYLRYSLAQGAGPSIGVQLPKGKPRQLC